MKTGMFLCDIDQSITPNNPRASFAAACALFWQDKKRGTPALILATLIAFSRLYFYLHFFTDVLCGSLIGLLVSIAAHFLTPIVMKGIDAVLEKVKAEKKA